MLSKNAPAQSNDEKNVAVAVAAFNKATLEGDRKALVSITAHSLSYGHSSGKMEGKNAFIDALATGKSKFISLISS